jgi:hypothetical protein
MIEHAYPKENVPQAGSESRRGLGAALAYMVVSQYRPKGSLSKGPLAAGFYVFMSEYELLTRFEVRVAREYSR